jgi:hypothetical protein
VSFCARIEFNNIYGVKARVGFVIVWKDKGKGIKDKRDERGDVIVISKG